MAEDSLDPSTPRLDKQKEALTSPSATTHGLSGEGADFIREHGFGDEGSGAGQGLRTGSLKTGKLKGSGGLATGGLRNPDGTPVRRKLPRKKNNTGGGGVAVVGDDAGVHVREIAKAVAESLALLAKPLQQFQVYRGTANDAVKVYEGIAFNALGTQYDGAIVYHKIIVPTSGDITVTGAGSIWALFELNFVQQSYSETHLAEHKLTTWRTDSVTFDAYSYRASGPLPDFNNTDQFKTGSANAFWVEIAEVQLVATPTHGNYAGLVRQLQVGSLGIPNFTDAEISS